MEIPRHDHQCEVTVLQPKATQIEPKIAQGRPQSRQDSPKRHQDTPKEIQKETQDSSMINPKSPKTIKDRQSLESWDLKSPLFRATFTEYCKFTVKMKSTRISLDVLLSFCGHSHAKPSLFKPKQEPTTKGPTLAPHRFVSTERKFIWKVSNLAEAKRNLRSRGLPTIINYKDTTTFNNNNRYEWKDPPLSSTPPSVDYTPPWGKFWTLDMELPTPRNPPYHVRIQHFVELWHERYRIIGNTFTHTHWRT